MEEVRNMAALNVLAIEAPLRKLLSAFGCEVSARLGDRLDNDPACAKAFDAILEAKPQALEEAPATTQAARVAGIVARGPRQPRAAQQDYVQHPQQGHQAGNAGPARAACRRAALPGAREAPRQPGHRLRPVQAGGVHECERGYHRPCAGGGKRTPASSPIEYTVMVRTVPLTLDLPEDRFLPMMEGCADIFNTHTAWSSENRTWNKYRVHDALYRGVRESHPEIPSAILQATRDCALEASKRCNKGRKGEWKTPVKRTDSVRYNLRTLSLRGNLLTLSCVGRRFRVVIDIPERFRPVAESWELKGATLKHVRGRFRLNLTYEADAPPKVAGRAIGVDVGSRNFAVTSDGDRHPARNPGALRAVKRRYHHNRRESQAKGTPSAKRRLRATAGREERFSRDLCHVVSKAIAGTPGVGVFVLEDLGGIRDRRRSRRLNREVHNLPFSRLLFDLEYKAEALGKSVETVKPEYTSQRCHRCGHTEPGNRRKSRFRCRMCGFCCHADDNASKNILFVYESGAVLRRSHSHSRRKAPDGQTAVNQPTRQGNPSLAMRPSGRKPPA